VPSSTRTKWLVAASALLALAVAAVIAVISIPIIHRSITGRGGDVAGSQLSAFGPQGTGQVYVTHPLAGHTYGFSFPQLHNDGTTAVQLVSASIDHVPAGVEVVTYRLYSLKEMGKYALGFADTGSDAAEIRNHADYSGKGVSIPAKSDGGYFFMVVLRLASAVRGNLSGCTVHWRVGTRKFHKSFQCQFALGE
jgi:hypothetical protein